MGFSRSESSAFTLHKSTCSDITSHLLPSSTEASATVLRSKGADSLLFGRGGKKMHFYQISAIKFHNIPQTHQSDISFSTGRDP
jgi:siroheme synthase